MAGDKTWSEVKRRNAVAGSRKGNALSRLSRGGTLAAKASLQQCFPRSLQHGYPADSAEIAYLPTTPAPLSAPAVASILERLHDDREELDDVQIVFSNEVIG